MRSLLIGSHAAKEWFRDFPREPKDVDVFANEPRDGYDTFWHVEFDKWIPEGAWVAHPRMLYTIKLSHSSWELPNKSWEKHVMDAMWLKKRMPDVGIIPRVLPDMYDMLYRVWEQKYGPKRVDLTQDKDAFFSDAVKRIYDHDSIHFSVAYDDVPIYERFLYDGAGGVKMNMQQVWASDFETQLRMFREEIYATALERWVIPSNYRVSPLKAYRAAVKKTIVSLTKGKSSLFLLENYDQLRWPDINYVQHHLSKAHYLERI